MSIIRTEKLTKTFRRRKVALNELDLDVRESEIFGLVGPEDSGKSTAIRLMLNFIRPNSGRAWLFGKPASGISHRQRLGYLPEKFTLPNYCTSQDAMRFYGRLSGLKPPDLNRRVDELLENLGLQDISARKISKCTADEWQRLGLVQAMLSDPDLLILDEPVSNMDSDSRAKFHSLVLSLKKLGKTVFIASPDASGLGLLCDRVAFLQHGELKRLEDLQTWNERSDESLEKLFLNVFDSGDTSSD